MYMRASVCRQGRLLVRLSAEGSLRAARARVGQKTAQTENGRQPGVPHAGQGRKRQRYGSTLEVFYVCVLGEGC